ncbi:hypothetical protein C8R44DRAFT_561450, partial [Mycena epipterygia]
FPPHSRGLLYYQSGPPTRPLEGSLRFRVTSDNTPSSFPCGQDLLAAWGLPWHITLLQIASHPLYGGIRHQLLRENLATEEQLSHCRDVLRTHRISPPYTLFRLDSLFLVNFSTTVRLTAVGDTFHSVAFYPFKYVLPNTFKQCFPWSGSALARFEPSTRPEYAGRRVVHMRIVKIIQPVACTVDEQNGRVLLPQEGQLLTRPRDKVAPKPWAYDID